MLETPAEQFKAPERVEELLSTLTDEAQRLINLSEELNDYLSKIEERINQTNAGVTVWLAAPVVDGYVYGYGKTKESGWRLLAKNDQGQQPLTNSPRAVRLGSLLVLEDLITAITKRVVEHIDQVVAVKKALKESGNARSQG